MTGKFMSTVTALCLYLMPISGAMTAHLDSLKIPNVDISSYGSQGNHVGKFCDDNNDEKGHERADNDDSETGKRATLLDTTLIPPHMFSSTLFKAVQEMIPMWVHRSQSLVIMAFNLHLYSLNKLPESARDLMVVILDNDCSEKKLLSRFSDMCAEFGGLENIPFFQKKKAKIEDLKQSCTSDSNDTESDGSIDRPDVEPMDEIPPNSIQSDPNQAGSRDCTSLQPFTAISSSIRPCSITPAPDAIRSPPVRTGLTINSEEAESIPPQDSIQLPVDWRNDARRDPVLSRALEREHERLMNATMCMVCTDRPRDVTLLPCGHFVLCSRCSVNCHQCPSCEKQVLAEVQTFLS